MKNYRYREFFLLLNNLDIKLILALVIMLVIIPSSVYAEDTNGFSTYNTSDVNIETNTVLKTSLNENNNLNLSNYQMSNSNTISDHNGKTMLLVSDKGGTNIFDYAALDIINSNRFPDVNIQVRSSNQISSMDSDTLYELISNSDLVICNWLTTDADAVLTNLLTKYPTLSNKELFIVLETSSSSQAQTFTLIKHNTVNYNKIFADESVYTANFLNEYLLMTKRGSNSFSAIDDYLTTGNGKIVSSDFNKLILYKYCNNIENQKNQILWAINYAGYSCSYGEPSFKSNPEYGLYREGYMSLEEYIAKYFDSSRPYVVGLLESNMYVSGNELQPYYALINSLESKGCNVIPVVAAGGSENQLRTMVKHFTNAPDYESFLANPSKYESYVDAIVSMVAYGVGGSLFENVTSFFTDVNVPVFRAVHSDYVSNGVWELSQTGLPGNRSDKWWHVAIGEAQGIIESTFCAGVTHSLTPITGAERSGYEPHIKNIDLFTDRVVKWVDLQYTNNSQKKISLVYYNYPPGKQNIGSSYLDSIKSIFNILYKLKAQGYNVGNLPANVSELENMMIKSGINVATWAPGELEKLANQSNIVLLPVSEYMEWFNSLEPISKVQVVEGPVAYIGELARSAIAINFTASMPDLIEDWYSGVVSLLPDNYTDKAIPILKNIVNALTKYLQTGDESDYSIYLALKAEFKALNISGLNGWGEAPGNIMTITRGGIQYFVIPGLTFGNIFVAPEPQRGWEADSDILYHSTAVAPTHQYLAAFYYMQKQYSSATVFTGRHATHEWLPGKEILLSSNDYGSIVVGNVPQIYLYISDGLGEGLQAKRRGYAVMISHLTSPLSYTNLYGNFTVIANLIHSYENTADSKAKENISLEIRSLIQSNGYISVMELTQSQFDNLSSYDLVLKADALLFTIQNTLYPLGLHAIGENWTSLDVGRTVSAALYQKFTYNGITTSLYDEIAQLKYSKNYDQLNALQRDKVIVLASDLVIALLNTSSADLALTIGSNSPSLIAAFDYAKYYTSLIYSSISNEMYTLLNALNGGYVPPCPAGDVLNINSLPTGGNFFHDQSQELPTKDAYSYANNLTSLTLGSINDTIEKIVMGIWCVETARDDGALVSVVLYLLGMKPVWTDSPSAGGSDEHGNRTGTKVKSMPVYLKLEDLVRPEGWNKKRIDVTIITSGNFRDLYSTQISLLDNAFRITLARSYITILRNSTLMNSKWGSEIEKALDQIVASVDYYSVGRESLENNYVAKHWIEDFIFYKELGYNTTYAAELAITRIFAPPNGDYGAGIAKAVSLSWTWNETSELGNFYIDRMGNMYSKYYWGETNPFCFMRALNNTGYLFVSRNTNVYGVLDNDDFFDYWGGLSLAMTLVNKKTPNMNVLMYGDKNHPYISSINSVIVKEYLTRESNPEWIKAMMLEGYSGARYISNKFFTNLFGWAVTRPDSVGQWMWDDAYNTYFNDKYGIGVTEWLKTGNNNYAFISSAGTLLTAAYNGYWKVSSKDLSNLVNQWAQAVIQNGVACCDCSCGNIAMMQWDVQYMNPDLLAQFNKQMYEATKNSLFATNDPSINPNNPTNPNSNNPSSEVSNGTSHDRSSSSVGLESRQSESSVGSSSGDSGSGESGEKGDSYEVTKSTSSSSSEVAMSIPAVLCIVFLVILVAVGYAKGKRNKED